MGCVWVMSGPEGEGAGDLSGDKRCLPRVLPTHVDGGEFRCAHLAAVVWVKLRAELARRLDEGIERFDASFGLSPDGYYSYSENPSFQGSATAGLLVEPAENFLLGVGWDVYFDGVVFTAAFAF